MKDLQYPLIIDTDAGADDLIALMLALHSSELFPDALLTSYGSFPEDETFLRICTVCNYLKKAMLPQIFRGASFPLERSYVPYYGVHGMSTLHADFQSTFYPAQTYVDILEVPDKLTSKYIYVCLGPLTNLATLLKTPFASHIKKAIIFGGTLSFPGNVTSKAEANFWWDPEAVCDVFLRGIPIELITLDASTEIQLGHKKISTLKDTSFIQSFFATYENFYTRQKQNYRDPISHVDTIYEGGVLHDPLTLLSLYDDVVTFNEETIVLDSICSDRGHICKQSEQQKGLITATVNVATKVNASRFWEIFSELMR